MKRLTGESATICLVCLFLLFILSTLVSACNCDPACTGCTFCENDECTPDDGECGAGEVCCGDGSCCDGTCCDGTCCDGTCCGGTCCDTTCCNDTCCQNGWDCIDGECKEKCKSNSDCDTDNCEHCDDEYCEYKCEDDQQCIDGECTCGDDDDCQNCESCSTESEEDCQTGNSCCGGECCTDGQCCGGNCCGTECCDGVCCPADQVCENGKCTKSCKDDGDCSSEHCQKCNQGHCESKCGPEESCCGNGNCCEGSCCGDTCCIGGESCVNGKCECDEHGCNASHCKECIGNECESSCATGEECCDGDCCESSCCNEQCCGSTGGVDCCDGTCCGNECCSDKEGTDDTYCCEGDLTCCEGICCDPNTAPCCYGTCCSKELICCQGNCCDPCLCQECDVNTCVDKCDQHPCKECDGEGECECYEIASVNANQETACVGCDVIFTATTDPAGKCSCVEWSGGGDPVSQSGGCTFTTQWDTTGTKTVTASIDGCSGSEESKQVTVVEVKITTPQYLAENDPFDSSGRYYYNSAHPGVCTIEATGTTGVSALDDGLEWSISTISGSTLTYESVTTEGPNIMKFHYTNLPGPTDDFPIGDFGEKTITLTHPLLPGGCNSDTQDIEIYFEPDAKNWPGAEPMSHPQDPNIPKNWVFTWTNRYYYYEKTAAHKEGCEYHYNGSTCSSGDHANGYRAWVGCLANPHHVLSYTHECESEIKNNDEELHGIDVFAWASRHEWKHHEDYTAWWGSDGVDPNNDLDGDHIRDDLEEEEGFFPCADGGPYDPDKQVTYEDFTVGLDDQMECLFTQETWTTTEEGEEGKEWRKGDEYGKDWAYPGSRWYRITP